MNYVVVNFVQSWEARTFERQLKVVVGEIEENKMVDEKQSEK